MKFQEQSECNIQNVMNIKNMVLEEMATGILRKMSRNIQNDTTTWLECLPADQVVAVLTTTSTLLEMNANIQRAHGQCYDSATTVAGE